MPLQSSLNWELGWERAVLVDAIVIGSRLKPLPAENEDVLLSPRSTWPFGVHIPVAEDGL